MKSFRRIVRRRLEAAKRGTRRPPQPLDVVPIAIAPRPDLPCEVIDLATESFEATFPDIAARLRTRPMAIELDEKTG